MPICRYARPSLAAICVWHVLSHEAFAPAHGARPRGRAAIARHLTVLARVENSQTFPQGYHGTPRSRHLSALPAGLLQAWSAAWPQQAAHMIRLTRRG